MRITRRQALAGLAAGTAAGAAARPISAKAAQNAANPALVSNAMCVLTPQADEGPFYFDPKLKREDITDGRRGVPLKLLLQVVNAGSCAPIADARVDVWHADAIGEYSGYSGQSDSGSISTKGKSFLRGTQFTDASGIVQFTTIYPGWYQGRTPHMHMKVFLADKTVLTGQLYFPDALSEFIYRNAAPYNGRKRRRDTSNSTDGVLRESGGGHESFCNIKEEADHYLATLLLGVKDEAAKPSEFRGPPPPDGPPPGGPRRSATARTARRSHSWDQILIRLTRLIY